MFTRQRLSCCLWFVLFTCAVAVAQEERRPATKPQPADVAGTVAASGERARFTAHGSRACGDDGGGARRGGRAGDEHDGETAQVDGRSFGDARRLDSHGVGGRQHRSGHCHSAQ